MHTATPSNDPAKARPLTDEADIGSGEKTPGQLETEKIIADIPALPRSGKGERAEPGTHSEQGKAGPHKDQ